MTAHHWLVHFPVALLVVGAAADAVGALAGSDRSRYWATPLLVAGSAAALLAFFTGQGAMLMMQGRAAADGAVATHAQWGGAAVWPIAASGALRLAWRTRLAGPRGGCCSASPGSLLRSRSWCRAAGWRSATPADAGPMLSPRSTREPRWNGACSRFPQDRGFRSATSG